MAGFGESQMSSSREFASVTAIMIDILNVNIYSIHDR